MKTIDGIAQIVALDDPAACSIERFGGKGARLAMMRQAGFPVPDGVVVAAEAFAGMFHNEALSASALDTAAVEDVAVRLQKAVMAAEFPDQVRDAAANTLARLGPLAVRSSGVKEDGASSAGAGQNDSVLGLVDSADLETACKRVLASQFASHALRYWGNGVPGSNQIALILQRMLAPSASGVVFTRDPVSSDRGIVLFEAAWGLATSVVQGDGVTERTAVRRTTLEVASQELRSGRPGSYFDRATGALTTRPDSNTKPEPVLTDVQRIVLVETACAVEDFFGMPVDVEWSIESGELFLLQARPITAMWRTQ